MASRRKQCMQLKLDGRYVGKAVYSFQFRHTRMYPHHSDRQVARNQRQQLSMIKNTAGQEHIGKVAQV